MIKKGDLVRRLGKDDIGIITNIREGEYFDIFYGDGLHVREDTTKINHFYPMYFDTDRKIPANFLELVVAKETLDTILSRRATGLDPFERHDDEPENNP